MFTTTFQAFCLPLGQFIPWTACGFVCNVSISLIRFFSTNNTNWLKLEQWQNLQSDPYDRIASNNANSLLNLQRLPVFWAGRGTKNIRARVRARENPSKPLLRTWFLGTRPPCFPSPGCTFFCRDDRKPKFQPGLSYRQPSNISWQKLTHIRQCT